MAEIVFDLTPLTRKAQSARRWVISGFEIKRRNAIIFLSALPAAVVVTGILWIFVGAWALIAGILTIVAFFWLIEGRSQQGMQQNNWRHLRDRSTGKGRVGTFMVAGMRVDPGKTDLWRVVSSTKPATARRRRLYSQDYAGSSRVSSGDQGDVTSAWDEPTAETSGSGWTD